MGQSTPCGQYQIPGVSETEYCTWVETKVRKTKSEISMHAWCSPMSAALQGAFVVIPEISLCDELRITMGNLDEDEMIS